MRAVRAILFSAMCLVVGVHLSACSSAPMKTVSRSDAAKAAATGFIAAVARGDSAEIASRTGSSVPADELAFLRRTIPATRGTDPAMYSASIPGTADVQGDGVIQVSVVEDRVAPPVAGKFTVAMTWEPRDNDWRVLSVAYIP